MDDRRRLLERIDVILERIAEAYRQKGVLLPYDAQLRVILDRLQSTAPDRLKTFSTKGTTVRGVAQPLTIGGIRKWFDRRLYRLTSEVVEDLRHVFASFYEERVVDLATREGKAALAAEVELEQRFVSDLGLTGLTAREISAMCHHPALKGKSSELLDILRNYDLQIGANGDTKVTFSVDRLSPAARNAIVRFARPLIDAATRKKLLAAPLDASTVGAHKSSYPALAQSTGQPNAISRHVPTSASGSVPVGTVPSTPQTYRTAAASGLLRGGDPVPVVGVLPQNKHDPNVMLAPESLHGSDDDFDDRFPELS